MGPDWTKELSRWIWVIVLLFTSHLCSSTSLLSSSNFRKYKTGKYISWLKLCAGVQCADLRHVWMECRRRWSAFLSKHSRSRKPRAIWQGLASVAIWFESTVSFLPHTLPFLPNFQFHPQIELLPWHLPSFFFSTGLMSQHVISSSFLVTQGKGIVVWSSEAISTSYSSFSTSNDSASGRATATAVKTKPHARLKSWTCQQGHVSVASPLLREALGNKSRWHCMNSRLFLKL